MKYFRLFTCIVFTLVFVSCAKNKSNNKPNSNPKKFEKKVSENFENFNLKFHSDSVFQLSRVDFPIEGTHIAGFEHYNWTPKNWEFLRVPVSDTTQIGDYEHSLVKTDTLVIEKFWIENSGFEVERQFKLINNKWFLIYYNDINL